MLPRNALACRPQVTAGAAADQELRQRDGDPPSLMDSAQNDQIYSHGLPSPAHD